MYVISEYHGNMSFAVGNPLWPGTVGPSFDLKLLLYSTGVWRIHQLNGGHLFSAIPRCLVSALIQKHVLTAHSGIERNW